MSYHSHSGDLFDEHDKNNRSMARFKTDYATADQLLKTGRVMQGKKIQRDPFGTQEYERVVSQIPAKIKQRLTVYAIENQTNLSSIVELAILSFAVEIGLVDAGTD